MLRYSVTIFLSAFLLFQVQPLIAKVILPWFGGTSAVWTTCMMFFQIALLLGYLYAHALRMFCSPKLSWIVHTVVAVLVLLTLPIVPAETLKPDGSENLTLAVVRVLLLSVGAPFFLLSTTGPLIQAWQSASHQDASPYRLYALSNIGSLLALVSYPFVFEPLLPLANQSFSWSVMFGLFVVCCVGSGWQLRDVEHWHAGEETPRENEIETQTTNREKSRFALFGWIALAMIPSVMLLATTSLMCQEIASVPFLWILPLSIYLISFIICFEKPNWYRRGFFTPLLLIAAIGGIVVLHLNTNASLSIQIGGLALVLFSVAMTCHGELESIKPDPSRLTLFYLFVSLGGSLGGIFAVVIAPLIFDSFLEFHLAILLTLFVAVGIPFAFAEKRSGRDWVFGCLGLASGGLVLASLTSLQDTQTQKHVVYKGRNEYGTFSVRDYEDERIFVSGSTNHGGQRVKESEKFTPYGYYCPDSGFGVAVSALREAKNGDGLRVGVIGLGIGSMLSWAESKDHFDFFEINPRVEYIARNWFTYLDKLKDQTRVFVGDGRIKLERQQDEPKYDVLAVDAFSSDSIPVHLLTQQCFDLYLDRLSDDGILVFHISNQFIDLKPVVYTAAKEKGRVPVLILVRGQDESDKTGIPRTPSTWVLVVKEELLQLPMIQKHRKILKDPPKTVRWTDDFAPIAPLLDTSFSLDWDRIKKRLKGSFSTSKKE